MFRFPFHPPNETALLPSMEELVSAIRTENHHFFMRSVIVISKLLYVHLSTFWGKCLSLRVFAGERGIYIAVLWGL